MSHALRERLQRVFARATRRPVPVRIGIDIRSFYEPLTGIGWYLYHLLHEFAKSPDVELYLFGDARVTDEGPRLHAPIPANARLAWFDLRGRGRISRVDRALTAAAYVLWMKIIDADVMFAPNYFLPRLLGAVARRRVITVHDLTYKRFPELLQVETLRNLESHMARELAAAQAIVCVSDSTRRDLLHYYQIDPGRAVTIHSGLGTLATPSTGNLALPESYILFVSTIEPRKNLEVLLDAFEHLRERGAYSGSLVIAGRVGWKSEHLLPRLRQPGVVQLDYVSAEDLAAVYERAEVFVFPSFYEGFGFPLLEAMAYGVPAIAARSSSLPEIGGDASLYFDPHDSRELERQIELVLADRVLRQDLIRRGHKRAEQFQWSDAAARTLEVLRRAV